VLLPCSFGVCLREKNKKEKKKGGICSRIFQGQTCSVTTECSQKSNTWLFVWSVQQPSAVKKATPDLFVRSVCLSIFHPRNQEEGRGPGEAGDLIQAF
jgi:hypothetical protein